MVLLVRCELLALLARLQMDAEVGDAQQRARHVDQAALEGPARLDDDAPRHGELTVEPRVPQAAAVALDRDLHVPVGRLL